MELAQGLVWVVVGQREMPMSNKLNQLIILLVYLKFRNLPVISVANGPVLEAKVKPNR
jgi:hypothetical protein